MDVGKFKASRGRLISWVIIPPILAVSVVLSTFAWQQYMAVELQKAQALSDVLPDVIESRRLTRELVDSLGLGGSLTAGNENQLISLLQDAAMNHGFEIESIQVDRQDHNRDAKFPLLSAQVEGAGDFKSIQLFINAVRDEQRLLSVDFINLALPRDQDNEEQFEVDLVFNMLLIDGVILTGGAL